MRNNKLMASFAVTLVALSLVGVAFAGWTDQVVVEGTAHMGDFIVGILTDPLPDGPYYPDGFIVMETTNGYPEDGTGAPPHPQPESFVPKPWVADTVVTLDDFETSVHHEPTQTVAKKMTITVDNAYPQYDAHVYFLLKNAGTVPAHLRVLFGGATVEWSVDPIPTKYDLELVEVGWYRDGDYMRNEGSFYDPVRQVDVILWKLCLMVPESQDPSAVQIEPCNHYEACLEFSFTQEAEECHIYRWSFIIDAIQWNKDYEWDLS